MTFTSRTRTLALGAFVACFTVAAVFSAFPSTAQEPPGRRDPSAALSQIKERAAVAVDLRLDAISEMETAVGDSNVVTEEHRSVLLDMLASTAAGLTSLGETIAADTEISEALAHSAKIVTDYRVFVLLLPQVRLVLASDGVERAAAVLGDAAATLEAASTAAREQGRDTTEADAAIARLRENLEAAKALVEGLASEVLALDPSGWPDNEAARDQARDDVRDAASALREARGAAHEAARALHAAPAAA